MVVIRIEPFQFDYTELNGKCQSVNLPEFGNSECHFLRLGGHCRRGEGQDEGQRGRKFDPPAGRQTDVWICW
jgi:hypothetical protein